MSDERVQVTWVDSVSHDGWTTREDAIKRAAEPDQLSCVSVGFLLANEKDYVLLATSYMRHGDLLQGFLQIPREAVREVKGLRR